MHNSTRASGIKGVAPGPERAVARPGKPGRNVRFPERIALAQDDFSFGVLKLTGIRISIRFFVSASNSNVRNPE